MDICSHHQWHQDVSSKSRLLSKIGDRPQCVLGQRRSHSTPDLRRLQRVYSLERRLLI